MGDANGARGNGGSSGGGAKTSPDDARSDEEIVEWFLHDSADALDSLSRRARSVASLVSKAGLDVARPARIELRKNARLTFRLLEVAFSDLD